MKNIVSYKAPKLKPLPTSITTENISAAPLPIKIENARRAIAACEDLSELLFYRDQAQGLAAAVKVMKNVAPAMIKSANRMCKEALFRLGELLLRYNGVATKNYDGERVRAGKMISDRSLIAEQHGLRRVTASHATRLAQATLHIRNELLADDDVPANIQRMVMRVPPRVRTPTTGRSDAMRSILSSVGQNHKGLTSALRALRHIPLDAFQSLARDERALVKAKITEAIELLDKMDQLCGG